MSKKVKKVLIGVGIFFGVAIIAGIGSESDTTKSNAVKETQVVQEQAKEEKPEEQQPVAQQPVEQQPVDTNKEFMQDASERFQQINFYIQLTGEEGSKLSSNPNYYEWFKEAVIYYIDQMVPYTYTPEEMATLTEDQYTIAYDINTVVGFYAAAGECLKSDDINGCVEYLNGVQYFVENTAMKDINNFVSKYGK